MDFRLLGPLEVLDEGRVVGSAGKQAARAARPVAAARQRDAERGSVDRRAVGEAVLPRRRRRRCRSTSRDCARRSRPRPGRGDARARLRAPARRGALDAAPVRATRGRPVARRRGDPSTAARDARDALALWRGAAACGSRLRAVRSGRDRPARGVAAGGARRADRGRPGARSRTGVVGELETLIAEHPLPGATAGAADAGAVPLGPPSRSARRSTRTRAALVEELGIEPGERCASSTRRSSARIRGSICRRQSAGAGEACAEPRQRVRRPRARAGPAGRRCSTTRSPAADASSCSRASPGSERAGSPRS